MQSKMKNISRNVLTRADIENPPNSFAIGGFSYLSTEINAKLNGGEAGIRTQGPLRGNGFQDRRIRPLCHLSKKSKIFWRSLARITL